MDELARRQFVELEERHFWFIGRRRLFFDLLEREVGGRRHLRILDVGCGAGGMLGPLGASATSRGSTRPRSWSRSAGSGGSRGALVGSADDPPVQPGSLDLVTLFDTLEHIPDDEGALRHCRDALAPGGLLFASVPAYQFLYANNDRVAQHERRYTARELRRKLVGAGLEPVRVSYFNTLLFPLILPAVLAKKARERMTGPDDSTNLSTPLPGFAHRVLAAVMGSERHLVSRWQLPFGHSIVAIARGPPVRDTDADRAIVERALPYTMTGERACWRVIDAVRLLRGAGRRRERSPSAASGAAARCSRWSLTLQDLGVTDRDLYLFDTFEGMTEPDRGRHLAVPRPARAGDLARGARPRATRPWAELFDAERFNEEAVRETLLATGYPAERSTSSAARSRRRCPTRAPSGSRSCASTPTGTSPPATSSSTSTPASRRAAC